MPSHFHRGLGISLFLPVGWEGGSSPDFPLLAVGPVAQSYRSNLGFSRSKLPAVAEVVDRMLEAARAQQNAEYPGFVELSAESMEIDGHPAFFQTYEWQPPDTHQPFRQWFGLVRTPDHGLIEVNGATLRSLATTVEPRVLEILHSARFIPFV